MMVISGEQAANPYETANNGWMTVLEQQRAEMASNGHKVVSRNTLKNRLIDAMSTFVRENPPPPTD